jgi:hypothetical protein
MIKLTDAQLDAIFRAAGPLHPDDRSRFLERVAAMLGACVEIGDGTVGRIAVLAQKESRADSRAPPGLRNPIPHRNTT